MMECLFVKNKKVSMETFIDGVSHQPCPCRTDERALFVTARDCQCDRLTTVTSDSAVKKTHLKIKRHQRLSLKAKVPQLGNSVK